MKHLITELFRRKGLEKIFYGGPVPFRESRKTGKEWLRWMLCGVFFSTQCVFAFSAETQFWESRRRSAQLKSPHIALATKLTTQFPAPIVRSVSMGGAVRCPVPAAFFKENEKVFSALSPARGTLRKVAFPRNPSKNGPVVVHIQDVHNNAQAQINIRDTVYSLGRSGAVSRVALEGAHGPIRLQPYWGYANQKVVAKAADSLLKKNRISGPVRAALSLGNSHVEFVGVDDPDGYKANVRAYRASAPLQDQRRVEVDRIRQKLAEEKKAVYSPALLGLDNAVEAYRVGKISLGDYVEAIAKIKSPPDQVRAFLKAVRTERGMDLNKVETERKELIGILTGKLNEQDINELLSHSVAVRAGEIRSTDFFTFFDLLCRKNGLSLKGYPAFAAYVQYVLETDGIDAEKLMVQLTHLESAAFEKLAMTPAQRNLVKRSRRAWLTEKLVNFDLTRLEWEEYARAVDKDFPEGLSDFESFYREAEARDHAIASNLLKSLPAKGAGVLVTGGYHAQGIADLLTQQGVTVLSFVPKIDHVETAQGSSYLSVFSQEKTPLEKMFVGDRLFLAPVPDAGLAYEGTLVVPGLDVLDREIGPEEVAAFIKSTTGVDAKAQVERDGRDGSGVTLTVVADGETHKVHVTAGADLEDVPTETTHPKTRSLIRIIRELYVRTFKRGRRVDPSVKVLPIGASVEITIPSGAFNSDGSGILDFVRVKNYLAVNGSEIPWSEARKVWAENSGDLNTMVSEAGLLSGPQSVGIPTNNVGMNFGYMVYQDGAIYHKNKETDQSSPHLWVVISQSGEARLQTIQFRSDGDRWVPQTAEGKDFPNIRAAFRGPTLIQNGVARIDPSEWEDLRHLFRLPVFDIPGFSGGMLTWGFADGTGQLFNDLELRQRAFNGEGVALSLSPLSSNGVTPAQRDRVFSEWGYIRRENKAEVKDRGEYFVDDTQNQVFIKLLPGYHPHTVVGQNRQGELVAIAVLGETNKAGATLEGLAQDLKRRGIVNAVVVGNGKDAQIYSGGQSAAVAGAYPTATALLSFFPPPNAAGTPQPIPDESTIQGHLTRIRGELTNMEIEETEVEEILDRVREMLQTGRGYIRPDPVRLVVYGNPKTRKPVIGPLPPGMSVEDLVPVGDLDYVVTYHGFRIGIVYVITRAPGGKFVTILRPWNPYAYQWTFPSGVQMPGSNIKDSALHEVVDEVSLPQASLERLTPAGVCSVPGGQVVNVYYYDLTEEEYAHVIDFQKRTRDRRAELWDRSFLSELAKNTLSHEGEGEVLDVAVFDRDELISEIQSGLNSFVPEMALFLKKGYLKNDTEPGRATAVRWLKGFEKIGALLSGEAGRERWGKAYKDFAATVELASAFISMLVGLGGTLVLAGSPLGWAVSPLLGAVFGWRFYKGHFLKPGESGPVTPVHVSLPKAFTMAVIYAILISVTPFLLGFGPDSLAYFNPVLVETLWGSSAALHLFFDRKTSPIREGALTARQFIEQLSTVPGAFNFLTPINADRTNQLLNSGPFSPDLVDQTLRRLQTDMEFRAGFLKQIRTSVQDHQLSPLQLNLLTALLASTSEPLGIVHFVGTDPENELDGIESLVSPSVRLTVVAPTEQKPSTWQRTESLKTRGVNVIRKNPGDRGWTEHQLTELEREMSSWLQSVPSSLLATVGPSVEIDPAEIDRLGPDSRLKPALSVAVGLLGKTLKLYFRILQAVQSSA